MSSSSEELLSSLITRTFLHFCWSFPFQARTSWLPWKWWLIETNVFHYCPSIRRKKNRTTFTFQETSLISQLQSLSQLLLRTFPVCLQLNWPSFPGLIQIPRSISKSSRLIYIFFLLHLRKILAATELLGPRHIELSMSQFTFNYHLKIYLHHHNYKVMF